MKQKEIILISVSMSILVLAWIVFSVHHNATTSTISEALNMRILPINSGFDTGTVEKLKKRKKISPLFNVQIPTPTGISTTPVATPSAALTPTSSPTPMPASISPTITQTQVQIIP